MQINSDFSKPALARASEGAFVPSPLPGVERRMLDRIGGEVARATTIVRYAAGSRFDAHKHDFGEEFFVLDGVFSDASGDFPAGTYVRNPPGSSHAPWSAEGCTIFVKLRQFQDGDSARVVADATKAEGWTGNGAAETFALHEYGEEKVFMLRLAAGVLEARELPGGAEFLMIEGAATINGETLSPRDWMRLPRGSTAKLSTAPGALFYVKTGHLAAG
ncbi:MAG: cupin domain-containing protein [Parvularculaceae bacterium]